jgi:hypothetical protein
MKLGFSLTKYQQAFDVDELCIAQLRWLAMAWEFVRRLSQ